MLLKKEPCARPFSYLILRVRLADSDKVKYRKVENKMEVKKEEKKVTNKKKGVGSAARKKGSRRMRSKILIWVAAVCTRLVAKVGV